MALSAVYIERGSRTMANENHSPQSGQMAARPLLQSRQMLPSFTLPGPDGMPHSPWDYKQREHLILLFLRSSRTTETRGLVRTFAQAYKALREEDCAILAITPDPVIENLRVQEELRLPFALLADPQGAVISRYTD